jgi:hypothetical protein
MFDGQVSNGGITQFFWNCQDHILEVFDAIRELGPSRLVNLYAKAFKKLVAKMDRWHELRAQWCQEPKWEAFEQTYDLLKLEWFEKAYFNYQGWFRIRPGLQHTLLSRLVDFVKSNKAEFVID